MLRRMGGGMYWGNAPGPQCFPPAGCGGAQGRKGGGARGGGRMCCSVGVWAQVAKAARPGGTSGGPRPCRCLTGAALAVFRGGFGPAGASRGQSWRCFGGTSVLPAPRGDEPLRLWPGPTGLRCSLAASHRSVPTRSCRRGCRGSSREQSAVFSGPLMATN